jgi:hypothetical protein
MAGEMDFTKEEWDLLTQAVDAAAMAVLAAQPGGAVAEREATFAAWRESAQQPFAENQLVLSLIRNRDTWGEEMRFRTASEESLSSLSLDQVRAQAVELCKRATEIVMLKASPQEREGYRQWVLYLMQRVAAAVHKGVGQHSQPSKLEQSVMNDVAAALA